MATWAEVTTVVYDSKITAMSYPGGMVFRWAYQRRKKVERLAMLYAPKRTGHLARSISGDYNKVPNGVVMHVTAEAYYGMWVHEGTHGPIFPVFSTFLRLRAGNGYPVIYKRSVRGQRPQPFLSTALHEVMRDL